MSATIVTIPIRTVVRMLRIALGYGSRTERITRLVNSTDPDVALTAHSLKVQGYLCVDDGTVDISPK